MLKVAIIGATGYTGMELLRLLAGHPKVVVSLVTSRKEAGKTLSEIFPFLEKFGDLTLVPPEPALIAERAEVAFLCVPHGAAARVARDLLENGLKVIDLSADFRLKAQAVYEAWYEKHQAPELLAEAVYGLPEVYAEEIARARLIANPGCYPTASLLPLIPLLRAGLLEPQGIIIDAKSGVSGAGRSAKLPLIYCEVNEGFRAYNVARHRHTPEIEQELSRAAGVEITINFTTHLIPINRGILSTIYAPPKPGVSEADLRQALEDFYGGRPFVRVLPEGAFPNTAYVKGTNRCDIGLALDKRTGLLILVSAIDNLVKGASGQAVQNLNLMAGWPEDLGLKVAPLFP